MSIELISVKCPECGATLSIENDRKEAFCSYCGTKVLIHNTNEFIHRHIDETEVRKAENEKAVRMRELEIEATKQKQAAEMKRVLTKAWLIAIGIVAAISFVLWITDSSIGGLFASEFLFLFGGGVAAGGAYLIFKFIPEKEQEKELIRDGGIAFPKGLEPFTEKHYETVYESLSRAGFYNISCVSMHDIKLGILEKSGRIEKISVNGKRIHRGGRIYAANASIVITYHGR